MKSDFEQETNETMTTKQDIDNANTMNRNDEEKKTWIISRHPGAIEWIRSHGIDGEVIEHFDGSAIPGNTYVGILPVNLIAKVLDNEAKFVLLVMPNLPAEARGKELTSTMMDEFGAKLLWVKELVVEEVI